MVDFDELRAKAEDFLEEHADQVDDGIDKAAGFAAKKYGHGQEIDQGADKLKEFLPGNEAEESGKPARGAGQRGPRQQGRPRGQAAPGEPSRPSQRGRRGGGGRRPGPGH